ncbi:flavin reductase family protein [Actinomyces wuliandei]|uniref:flavin reductase family protein n=1 Tax=Actinomyces wuliandei TaxID=2057743 RepID=UPI0015D5B9E9|nr:flavin reductase family protein [Actinomyces wuliandei]
MVPAHTFRFASGVTVVTAMADGRPVGMTCQVFASVSLSPPLVLFRPGRSLRVWPLIRDAGTFAVNFLTHQQAGVAERMGRSNPHKFEEISWSVSGVSLDVSWVGWVGLWGFGVVGVGLVVACGCGGVGRVVAVGGPCLLAGPSCGSWVGGGLLVLWVSVRAGW